MQRTLVTRAVAAAALAAAVAIPASSAFGSGTLTGAGSTLVQPLVQTVWAPDFNKTQRQHRQLLGGRLRRRHHRGHRQDGRLRRLRRADDLRSADRSAAASRSRGRSRRPGPAFNISGVTKLNLSGSVLAGIYLGTITQLERPAIAKLNKGVTLPEPRRSCRCSAATPRATPTRSPTSSTTRAPTGSRRSASARTVHFPVGTGAKGNSGVAGVISSTEGAIGYVSTFYVRDNGLHEASVENLAGKFVYPYIQDIAAAAALVTHVTPERADLDRQPGLDEAEEGREADGDREAAADRLPDRDLHLRDRAVVAEAGGPAQAVPELRDQRRPSRRRARRWCSRRCPRRRSRRPRRRSARCSGAERRTRDAAGACRPRRRR